MKGLLFTYLLTYGGAAASLVNPWIGLLVYVCFAIIKPESLWYWAVPAGNYSRIVALALLAGWFLKGLKGLRFGAAKPVVMCLIGFFIWNIASAIQSPDKEVAFIMTEQLAKIVLPVVVGLALVDSVAKLRQLAWVIMVSQGYVAYELNMAYYGGFNRLQEVGFGGMDNNCVAIAMVAGAGLAFMMGLGESIWWRKLLCFATAGLMAHSIMFAFSRGGMLGLIIVGLTSFFLIPKQPKHYFIFALAVVLALRLAGPQVIERFASTFADKNERDGSAQSRLDMWSLCLGMMASNPVLGIGPSHFPLVAHEYGLTHGKQAHTLWLQIGAEVGAPGLGFLVGFYALCCARLWRWRRYIARFDPWLADVARMVIASITGFAVSAQFVTLAGLELPYYVVMLGAGALKLAGQPEVEPEPRAAQANFARHSINLQSSPLGQ